MGVSLIEGGSGWKHPKAPLESLAKEDDRRQFEEAGLEPVTSGLSELDTRLLEGATFPAG